MTADGEKSSLLIALPAPARLSCPVPLELESAELENILSTASSV